MQICIREQELLCYGLRSARSRKRTAKKDFEKKLVQLHKLQRQLSHAIWNLPWVPLEEPYQKGWKRSFVLRQDVRRSRQAGFFETLLKKINRTEYSRDKSFTTKKRKKGRKYRKPVEQKLCEFSQREWDDPKCKLSDSEKQFFYKREFWNPYAKKIDFRYTFSEPWRFVLQIRPRMITKTQIQDKELLSRDRKLDNYIRNHHLNHKIVKLVGGYKQNIRIAGNCPRGRNDLKNKPVHVIVQESGNELI